MIYLTELSDNAREVLNFIVSSEGPWWAIKRNDLVTPEFLIAIEELLVLGYIEVVPANFLPCGFTGWRSTGKIDVPSDGVEE